MRYGSASCTRRASRCASSPSARSIVTTPSACPVVTGSSRRRQQVERDAVGGQAQVVELVDQPPLGRLGVGERGQGVEVGVGGPGAGERARAAEQAGRVHQPVAARHLGVGAAATARPSDAPVRIGEDHAHPRAAVQARRVLGRRPGVGRRGRRWGAGRPVRAHRRPRGSMSTATSSTAPAGGVVSGSRWRSGQRAPNAASSAGGARSSSAASSGGHTSSMAEGCHPPYRQPG